MIGTRVSFSRGSRFAFARVGTRVRRAEERDARERARASVECACACVMRGLTRALVVVASAVIFGRGGDAATCVEPKTRGDVETFRARAVALGIDLCVDATDRARGASLGVDASCDETILSVACDVALVDAPFACSAKTRVDGRREGAARGRGEGRRRRDANAKANADAGSGGEGTTRRSERCGDITPSDRIGR